MKKLRSDNIGIGSPDIATTLRPKLRGTATKMSVVRSGVYWKWLLQDGAGNTLGIGRAKTSKGAHQEVSDARAAYITKWRPVVSEN
jgi:hypothetical protein